MSELARDLARLVGAEHVLAGDAARPYERDATVFTGTADAVVLPGDADELAAVVAWAVERGVALVPRGGGSGLAGGAVPVEGGVVVATERLDRIVSIDAEAWRMTVGAGVRTATVHRLAREHGLLFPPDPGAAEQSTIGGNVATNAGGPHAFKYGATGAWTTGVEAVVPPGERVRVGGPHRKDVGGYDLTHLLVGSEGTLGVIAEVTLRLIPAPAASLPLVAFCADAVAGGEAVAATLGSGVQPAALEYLDGDTLRHVRAAYPGEIPDGAGFVILAEADGEPGEAAAVLADLRAAIAPYALAIAEPDPVPLWRWRAGVSIAVDGVRGGKVSEDVVVPPDRLADAVAGVAAIGREAGLPTCSWGHAGDGNLHPSVMVDPRDPDEVARGEEAAARFFALAVDLGGVITGEAPRALDHQARIRRAVDPAGVMNPGKKV
jgi:FAD/FMN-containing dehydrogenase